MRDETSPTPLVRQNPATMTARSMTAFDPEVVAPWELGSGRRGVLLIHGFAGTPPELRRLGGVLAENGWRCRAPALAGHGTEPEDLERTTWRDWTASAAAELDALAAECDQVMVAGQSMGATIALHLAATDPRVRGVASLAAPIWLRNWKLAFLPVIKRFMRWHVVGGDVDLYQPEAIEELHSYGMRSTRAIHEFMRLLAHVRDELARVRAPVLLLHGERDRTVDPANAADIERRLVCSAAVERHRYPRSGHALSVDVDRDDVNARVLAWFERFSG